MKLFTVLLATAAGLAAGESPFACDRSALTPEARKHHFDEVTPAVRKLMKSQKELPDGFAFEFPPDAAAIRVVAEWVASERLCCPFLDFTMRVERERGKFWLQLTGREGVKEFIRREFGL